MTAAPPTPRWTAFRYHAAGIYAITHIATGRRYVGSAVDIRARWKRHVYALRAGTHDNPHLQKAWNKYGPEAFRFEILDLCPVDYLLDCEQEYINGKADFNFCRVAGLPPNHSGRKRSAETRAKIAFNSRNISDETRARRKDANHITDAGRARIGAASRERGISWETALKISASLTGRACTPERRAKLVGVPWSEARRNAYKQGVGR